MGIHTGECELHDDNVAGLALAIGARICACAGPGGILVSGTVGDLVAGSGIAVADRGPAHLIGGGDWELAAVTG